MWQIAKRQNTNVSLYKKKKYKYDITQKDSKQIWQNTTINFVFCLVITFLHFVIFVLCLFVLCHLCILSFCTFWLYHFFHFSRHGPNLWKFWFSLELERKPFWVLVPPPPPSDISWQATPREIGSIT